MRYLISYYRQLHTYTGIMIYFNLLGMMAISFFEGLAAILLIPLVSLSGIYQVDIGSIPYLQYLDLGRWLPQEIGLPLLLGVYVVIIVGQQLLYNKLSIQKTTLQAGFMNSLRTQIYSSILHVKWEYHLRKRRSDFVNALTYELGRVSTGISQLLGLFASLLYSIVQVVIAFLLSPQITCFVLVCAFLLSLFTQKFITSSKAVGHTAKELSKSYYAGITDHFNGMKEIKTYSMESSMQAWLNQIQQRIVREKIANARIRNASQLYYRASSACFIAIFAYISIKMFHSRPEQLLIILIIFSNIWPKFDAIQSQLEKIAAAIPSCESLHHMQKQCEGLQEGVRPLGADAPISLNSQIEFIDISYRYDKSQPIYALRSVDITIPINGITAIVGHSGAGKSTLVDILMGLLEPECGHICIDGQPITPANLHQLRRMISYVPQDPHLFHGSIRDNLLMVCPDAQEDEIWRALEFASADEFIREMPQGLDTIIGDKGMSVSGGERQRIVLAKAILRQPPILVLDEATSALDALNELRIRKAMELLKGKMTIILIAHRMATIRNADQVIVLDKGEVIQSGPYNELSLSSGGVLSH